MKILIPLIIGSCLSASINLCDEQIDLGSTLNLKKQWISSGDHIKRKTSKEECIIFKEKGKAIRIVKKIKSNYLILPDTNQIDYIKIKYDNGELVLNHESKDKKMFPKLISATKKQILFIDSGYKENNTYVKMYSTCSTPSKNCENTFDTGFLIK